MAVKEIAKEAKSVLAPVIIGTFIIFGLALLGRIMSKKQ